MAGLVLAGAGPAAAAFVVTGDVLGQTCPNVNDKATCSPPFALAEIRIGDEVKDFGPALSAVTERVGGTCRLRIDPRGAALVPADVAPFMTAKFMVDTHDALNAVNVDFLVFPCREE